MIRKTGFLLVCLTLILNISAKSVADSSEENSIPILESLKIFVEFVQKHNLNVSIIASEDKKGPGGHTKEQLAITLHMPKNDKKLTTATLDTPEQTRYLQKIRELKGKEKVGAKIRVVEVRNGKDAPDPAAATFNPEYFIDSANYKFLTVYKDGKQGMNIPEGQTTEVLYNFMVNEGDERNIQVITGNVVIVPIEASSDMDLDKYTAELKKSLPLIWMSVDDDTLLAKLLTNQLDKAFPGKNHQVLIGVMDYYSSSKNWAKFKVADSNVVIFSLPSEP